MRRTFIQTLIELAAGNSRILLLTGDLGYSVLEPFRDAFPGRFFNIGVAEQNMIGLATGLAEAGFVPFTYSIATFAVLRPYEFIRNGPILQRLPVRIVGTGGGFDYGEAGPTHHALEDVGVMRLQPGITVIVPADYNQARTALLATWNLPGPIYYRLGKNEQTVIPELEGRFALGRAEMIRQGKDLLFISVGSIATEVMAATEILAAQGIECAVMVVSSFNPAPVEDLAQALAHYRLAVTVEAHYISGALGSLVSEVVAERKLPCRIVRCGVRTNPTGVIGSERYLRHAEGLSSERLAETILGIMREER